MILNTSKGAVIALGIFTQIALTALFLWRFEPLVENQLLSQSRTSLQQANINWARIEADGRDLEISGMAPTPELRQTAIQIVEAVPGVRILKDKLLVAHQVAVPEDTEELNQRAQELLQDIEDTAPIFTSDLPYELHMEVSAGVLTLSGLVPDDVAKQSILNLANREFGQRRLIDRLITTPGAPTGYLNAITHALTAAIQLDQGLVGVAQGRVFVQGVLQSSSDSQAIKQALESSISSDYIVSVQAVDRTSLDQLMRSHPGLAARVGDTAGFSRDETLIETVSNPQVSSTPKPIQSLSSDDCQQRFRSLLEEQSIGFETGSSDIDRDSFELIDNLVSIAKLCPTSHIEIGGHTDDQGTQQNNLALSQRRAESIMEYFVKNGVSLGRLSAVGYGEDQPLVPNTDLVNREINRRIEFKIGNENKR